jgi:Peptidase family M28
MSTSFGDPELPDPVPTHGASRRSFLATGGVAAGALAGGALAPTAAHAAHAHHAASGIEPPPWPDGPGHRNRPQHADATLRRILDDIDPARIRHTIETLVGFGTRHTLSTQTNPHRGIGAARDWIFAELKKYAAASGGRMTVEIQSYTQPVADRIDTPTVISNVIATLHGSESSRRMYVISGHYDSRVTDVMNRVSNAPGADDDASGVAVSMELARVFAKHDPRATIAFMAVAGEEQGLYGSNHAATLYKQAGADIQGMLNNDIVGSSTADDGSRDRHSVRLFAEGISRPPTDLDQKLIQVDGENDTPPRELGRFLTEVATHQVTGMNVRLIYRLDRFLRAGDHLSFLEQGYPAVRFTEPHENFDHEHQDVRVEKGVQFGDLPRFVDFHYVAGVARVNAAGLWSLANAPGTPRDVKVDVTQLTNDTTLTWALDPAAAGYEIVWRPTIEPVWTHVVPVGKVATATLKGFSKDNALIGVRAVGADGKHTPAVLPLPG